MRYIVRMIIALLLPLSLKAQLAIKDTMVPVSMIGFHYSFNIPGADLADRFGSHSAIGAAFYRKTGNNWLWGGEYSFIFGSNVRENTILDSITTPSYQLINAEGQFAFFKLYERGHLGVLKVGKIFPVFGPNPNSGMYFKFGAGFLEHKIRFYYDNNPPPQLANDYYKGYDRLTNGLALVQNIGFFRLDNKNYLNFTLEAEVMEAFTKNRRDWNYDTMMKDDRQRLDLSFGLKATLMLALYGKHGNTGYYY